MPRRAVTFATAAVIVFGLMLGGALLPVPYVALLPGPTKNVLGEVDGHPLITVDGHETYKASGHLNLVTVAYRGGPGYQLNLFTALRGWVDSETAIVPQRALFPEDKTAEEVRQVTSRKMRHSQETATVAALHELGIPVETTVSLVRVLDDYPAQGVLQKGDVLVAVSGNRIDGPSEVSKVVSAHEPGDKISFTIKRDGAKRHVQVGTVQDPNHPSQAMIGVYMRTEYDFPLQVKIRIDEIGGPSAGTMFALGIVDKLTKGDLTGGKFIAGTGTITPSGDVGPIGGIAQKMAGANQDGASIFLTPAKNCSEAREAKPEGLRLIKIKTLHGALQSLHALKTGEGSVPSC